MSLMLELPSGGAFRATPCGDENLMIRIWIAAWRRQYWRERHRLQSPDLGGEG